MTGPRPLMVLAILALAGPASAEFARVDLEMVPVERLLKNLKEIVDKDPKDAKAVINLARAHAMAFSLRADELEVRKGGEPNRLWLGYEPPYVPFNKVAPVSDPEKLKVAKAHLASALKHYDDALKLTPGDLFAQLGRAWLLTQTEKKTDAIEPLRKVIEKAWETEKDARGWFGDRLGIAAEASGYLIPMLDAEKDKAEIALYKARIEQMKKLPHSVTPIAVPLRADLSAADLEDRSARVRFDADGTGLPQEWSWITPEAAWLVLDPRRSGRVVSGRQLFGGVTFWMFWDSGYEALAALDDNHDGQLTGKELEGLALWHDANGNGVSDPGEVKPLADYGIVALSDRCERDVNHPDRIVWSTRGVTFRDGTTRPTYDLVLHSR